MPGYCEEIEQTIRHEGIELLSPIAHLGSDADYCGIGELYADQGSFRRVSNAYYLGGGTGAADAMLLKGQLIPFDEIKSWIAKTWEIKNDKDLSFERYASASGLQFIYSRYSGQSVEELNANKIYPPQIARAALEGEKAAKDTFADAARYLALLIFERISTLFCGSKQTFDFINPNRPPLEKIHMYRGEFYDRIVIGQRLGELMRSAEGQKVLTEPILDHLSAIIAKADCLSEKARNYYLRNNKVKEDLIVFSKLREAPALGAGIDAYLTYQGKDVKKP
jgi:predicted NBD/HSP70 family sugar kinase